MGIKINLYCF